MRDDEIYDEGWNRVEDYLERERRMRQRMELTPNKMLQERLSELPYYETYN